MTARSPQPRWSPDQIRAARLAPLAPLLQQRGLQLIEREAGNFTLPAYPGLIVKDSYWRWTREIDRSGHTSADRQGISRVWPQHNQADNAIDFFMRVLGLSFHDAMRQIYPVR
jgi:hypothetical protein